MSDLAEQVKQLTLAADQLKNAGQYPEAIAKLQELLQLQETHVLTHLSLSVLYFRARDFAASVKHALRACELEPNNPFNYTALSVTYQRAFAGTQDMNFIRLAEDAMARAHQLQGHAHRH